MKKLLVLLGVGWAALGAWEMPTEWRIFVPVPVQFQPKPAEIVQLPSTWGGVAGQHVKIVGGKFDFPTLEKRFKDSHCAWAFAEINAPQAQEFWIGAGADWFITVYLNGQVLIDTMESGNGGAVRCDSFIGQGNLRPGKNLLAFKLMRGNHSAQAVLGTAAMVRQLKQKLKAGKPDFLLQVQKEFCPKKAGWPLIFSDEFNGSTLDWSKWRPCLAKHKPYLAVDGRGHLVVTAVQKNGVVHTGEMFSKRNFKYGYFEARLKFTHQPGWWTSFWLYGFSNRNAMLDGMEIDIYEDYFFRPRSKFFTATPLLDFNFHIYSGSHLHSWKYSALVPEKVRDFHVLGCKWTPFEVTIYLDGKAIPASAAHSPWGQITFDAINHGTGITPLHVVFNGSNMGFSMNNRRHGGQFPEQLVVDYVRVYQYPNQLDPAVKLVNTPEVEFVPVGKKLTFTAEVAPNRLSRAPIRGLYLFDNGLCIAHRSQPPWRFEIPFDAKFYDTTAWSQTSRRSGQRNTFNEAIHAYAVFAQDTAGRVGHSKAVVKIPDWGKKSTPYLNQRQSLPGVLKLWKYDAGGPGVAYYDSSQGNVINRKLRPQEDVDANYYSLGGIQGGEYLNYSVNVKQGGKYRITLPYGTPYNGDHRVWLLVNRQLKGVFHFTRQKYNWGRNGAAELHHIELPQGNALITLVMSGGFNLYDPIFQLEK